MSGHSKWHNIQARKGKSDAQRGKIFTKIGREIAVVVKTGGADPVSNSKLRDVIAKAKQNNMPNDSIQRAIKKATGELSNVNYEETTYEGYGVGGSAVIVECLTDNKNRTAGHVRHTFDKHGGSLVATGCVSYLFKRKGVIILEKKEGLDSDEILMQALEACAKDVLEDEESFTIETAPDELNSVVESLNKNGIEVLEYSVEQVPDMYVELDEAKQTQFEKMIDALEDLDDVQNVYHNVK